MSRRRASPLQGPFLITLVLVLAAHTHLVHASTTTTTTATRALTGRFVHLTDMHPDPFYLYNGSQSAACHFDKPSGGERAGYWGAPVSDCDAPVNLVNATFDWLKANFRGEVDFVVWTGDNARHDIDSNVPRSLPEIFELNRYIAERIRDTFGKVPVVASIGNNDVYPHNIMFPGPSRVTTEFLDIWKHYIPENHLHTFARGGYYSIDAIPNTLLLISLNTLYMYDNNKAMDGCPPYSGKGDIDPGTEQMEWLEQQLLLARMRGMQVWLTGHVPATKENWYPMCWQRYGELVLSFHDTIVGHLFGHMNVDHFKFIRASDIFSPSSLSSPHSHSPNSPPFHTTTIIDDLLSSYLDLPSKKKTNLSDFGIVNVNPSVIPTYLPAVRVWQYNVSRGGLESWKQGEMWEGDDEEKVEASWRGEGDEFEAEDEEEEEEEEDEGDGDEDEWKLVEQVRPTSILGRLFSRIPSFSRPTSSSLIFPTSSSLDSVLDTSSDIDALKKKKKKKKRRKKKKPTYPKLPRYYSPHSPSCTNTFLTPLGYTQYYIDLESTNKHSGYGPGEKGRALLEKFGENGTRPPPEWKIEYTTFNASKMAKGLLGLGDQPSPIPTQLLPEEIKDLVVNGVGDDPEESINEVAIALKEFGLTPYHLKDLTIGSWIKLARKLGKSKKAWKKYVANLYVSSGEDGK